jgi:hypothetical protein
MYKRVGTDKTELHVNETYDLMQLFTFHIQHVKISYKNKTLF